MCAFRNCRSSGESSYFELVQPIHGKPKSCAEEKRKNGTPSKREIGERLERSFHIQKIRYDESIAIGKKKKSEREKKMSESRRE